MDVTYVRVCHAATVIVSKFIGTCDGRIGLGMCVSVSKHSSPSSVTGQNWFSKMVATAAWGLVGGLSVRASSARMRLNVSVGSASASLISLCTTPCALTEIVVPIPVGQYFVQECARV